MATTTVHSDLSKFPFRVATGMCMFLKLLLDFLERSPARSPALDVAVTAAVLAVVVVFSVGAFLAAFLYILSVQSPSSQPPAAWRYAALGVILIYVLLGFIEVPLVVLFL